MSRDILFKQEDFIFSYRVAGVLIHDGKILLQRPKGDDYSYIGGHVAAFETTEETLIREFREETGADVEVERLLAVGEVFFPWGKRPCHQIGLYYRIRLKNPAQIPTEGEFRGSERTGIDFCWIELERLADERVYLPELTAHILSGGEGVKHFVSNQLDA